MARVRSLIARSMRMKIDEPAVVVKQSVVPDVHRFQRREIFEQRIRRPGHQHFIARIAQQLEQPGIRFAGAGRQDHAIDRRAIFARDDFARRGQSERLRFIAQPPLRPQGWREIRRDTRFPRGSDSIPSNPEYARRLAALSRSNSVSAFGCISCGSRRENFMARRNPRTRCGNMFGGCFLIPIDPGVVDNDPLESGPSYSSRAFRVVVRIWQSIQLAMHFARRFGPVRGIVLHAEDRSRNSRAARPTPPASAANARSGYRIRSAAFRRRKAD